MGEISDGQPIFPGDSEVDQLYIIQKVLGPLTVEHNELFMTNARFAGLKFPDMSKPETLQKKYVGKLSKRALGYIRLLLAMEPADRPSAQECLSNIYFENLDKKFNIHITNAMQIKEKPSEVTTSQVPSIATAAQNAAQNTHGNSSNVESTPPLTHWPQIQVPSQSGGNAAASKAAKMPSGGNTSNAPTQLPANPMQTPNEAELKQKYKHSSKMDSEEADPGPPANYYNPSPNAPSNVTSSWHQYVSVAPSQSTNTSGYPFNVAGSSANASLDGFTTTPGSGSLADDKPGYPTEYSDSGNYYNSNAATGGIGGGVGKLGEADTPYATDGLPGKVPADMLPADGVPSSRQKSRKGRAAAAQAASQSAAETKEAREREQREQRARELEREAERERERQREKEIRAFRDFSTKLPIKQTRRSRGASFILEQQLLQEGNSSKGINGGSGGNGVLQWNNAPLLPGSGASFSGGPLGTLGYGHLGPLPLVDSLAALKGPGAVAGGYDSLAYSGAGHLLEAPNPQLHLSPPPLSQSGPGSRKTPRSLAVPPLDNSHMPRALHSRGGVGSLSVAAGPNTGRQQPLSQQSPQQQLQQQLQQQQGHMESKLLSPPLMHNPLQQQQFHQHTAVLQNTFADDLAAAQFASSDGMNGNTNGTSNLQDMMAAVSLDYHPHQTGTRKLAGSTLHHPPLQQGTLPQIFATNSPGSSQYNLAAHLINNSSAKDPMDYKPLTEDAPLKTPSHPNGASQLRQQYSNSTQQSSLQQQQSHNQHLMQQQLQLQQQQQHQLHLQQQQMQLHLQQQQQQQLQQQQHHQLQHRISTNNTSNMTSTNSPYLQTRNNQKQVAPLNAKYDDSDALCA
eukprot:CAMPEP_0170114422 /NCGR_PEP_ID=MMETSP0020_2-20130122/10691_1 /TAXON_ID=98059 /ORGANISM="Dinobryon sp., Strain UTEXLB2267" /LENGTH=849 /DNA_ID=CAMNT_0010341399 /DNA_START=538 /DNA_END=3084 /DNA_ORIENTATION=+